MTQDLVTVSSDCAEISLQNVKAPQTGDVMVASPAGDDPGRCSQVRAAPCAGIGIMVFSSTCRTVYANQAAAEFLKMLNRWEHGHATDGALPGAIAGLYDQMELLLARRTRKGDGEKLEARSLLTGEDRTVRLSAFGLRDRLGMRESRVVVTMQSLPHPFLSAESREAMPASI